MRPWFNSWVRKIRWRQDRLSTPVFLGFPSGSAGKESACNAGDWGSIPGLGRSPGERLSTPVFWAWEFHGLYSPCGGKESDMTEWLSLYCSPPGFSVHRIFQAKILEYIAISFSKGSSRSRDRTHISCTGRQVLYHRATGEDLPQLISRHGTDIKQKSCTKCHCQVPTNHMQVFSCALFTEHQSHVSMGPLALIISYHGVQDPRSAGEWFTSV